MNNLSSFKHFIIDTKYSKTIIRANVKNLLEILKFIKEFFISTFIQWNVIPSVPIVNISNASE